jgi:hypothetical protein
MSADCSELREERMSEELKKCPFCGNNVRYNINMDMEPDGIWCGYCKMLVRFTRVKAIQRGENFGDVQTRIAEQWNRRANDGQD